MLLQLQSYLTFFMLTCTFVLKLQSEAQIFTWGISLGTEMSCRTFLPCTLKSCLLAGWKRIWQKRFPDKRMYANRHANVTIFFAFLVVDIIGCWPLFGGLELSWCGGHHLHKAFSKHHTGCSRFHMWNRPNTGNKKENKRRPAYSASTAWISGMLRCQQRLDQDWITESAILRCS